MTSMATFFRAQDAPIPVQLLSTLKVGVGLAAFFAPTYFIPPFKRGLFSKPTARTTSSEATTEETKEADESALSPSPSASPQTLFVRFYAAHEIAAGLLLRSPYLVVARGLQVGIIGNLFDLAAGWLSFVDGSIDRQLAWAVGGAASVSVALQLWLLHRI